MIDSDNQKYDTGKYIGDSYRDLTRIANINEDLWTELFFTNKDNLLKAFDKNSMSEPDSKFVQVAFKVDVPDATDEIIINKAQITDDKDEDGKDVTDKDSTPNRWRR